MKSFIWGLCEGKRFSACPIEALQQDLSQKTCWCSTNCKDCCKNCECMVLALNCEYWNKAKRAKHRMKKSVLLLCIFVVWRKDLKDNPTLLSHKWLTFFVKEQPFSTADVGFILICQEVWKWINSSSPLNGTKQGITPAPSHSVLFCYCV